MKIICTDTNATVAGLPIPVGTCEFPFHGSIGVLTSGGTTTNFTVARNDTLIIWPTGAAQCEDLDPFQMLILGLWISLSLVGLLALARRIARQLSAGKVKEV